MPFQLCTLCPSLPYALPVFLITPPLILQVPVPEYDNTDSWDNSSTSTNSRSETVTTTIDFTPKVNVAKGESRTLSNLMYNGTASLPYKAVVKLGNGLKVK